MSPPPRPAPAAARPVPAARLAPAAARPAPPAQAGGVTADPDPDGVALAVAAAGGVVLGAAAAARAGAGGAWSLVALATALALLALGTAWRSGRRGVRRSAGAGGALALATLAAGAAAVGALRADAVRGGLASAVDARPTVAVRGTIAEEPHLLRGGARSVVISVDRVEADGHAWRTRERAVAVLPRSAGALGAGDRLRLRGRAQRALRPGRLGQRPTVALRRVLVEQRLPARSWVLRASESIRAGLRRRALASLPAAPAGLLAGMALGDTSLLPADLERAFQAAGGRPTWWRSPTKSAQQQP